MADALRRTYWRYRKGGVVAAARQLKEELVFPRNRIGDALWSIRRHRRTFCEFPNLLRPRRFSEYLLRLKLTSDGRSTLRSTISDKEFMKSFVEARLGPGFTAGTFAVLRSHEEIASYRFPSACAIKPTHASGEVILRRNEAAPPDLARMLQWLETNYYDVGREPNYCSLEPKVIVEELLVDPEREVPVDYKVFCFHGRPAFVQVDIDRFAGHRRGFYSTHWRELDFAIMYPGLSAPIQPPPQLSRMLDVAGSLSKDFSFVRADFYLLGTRLLVGELTNFPGNCSERFDPDGADHLAGRLFNEPDAEVERLFGTREVSRP